MVLLRFFGGFMGPYIILSITIYDLMSPPQMTDWSYYKYHKFYLFRWIKHICFLLAFISLYHGV